MCKFLFLLPPLLSSPVKLQKTAQNYACQSFCVEKFVHLFISDRKRRKQQMKIYKYSLHIQSWLKNINYSLIHSSSHSLHQCVLRHTCASCSTEKWSHLSCPCGIYSLERRYQYQLILQILQIQSRESASFGKRKLCFQITLPIYTFIIKYKICQDNTFNMHERICCLSSKLDVHLDQVTFQPFFSSSQINF